ncbi:MAG: tetratricopeptide repeat protein [Planctomycetes bacterium]|nr:tetratricopeptide repeat protein [Planctomycetota bacterium]
MRATPVIVLALLLSAPAYGGEDAPKPPVAPPAAPPAAPAPAATPAPSPTPEQAADAVLTAVKAKDDAALEALAVKDAPDPWIVADELIRRGEFDAADAFARAAPRVDIEALPAYVASRRGKPDDPTRRGRLAKAIAALRAREPADALAALGAEESPPLEDVVGVRLTSVRGYVLARLERREASAVSSLGAGDAAERLGWLARSYAMSDEAGISAFRESAFVVARAAFERAVSVCDRRGDKAGAARSLTNLGTVYASIGDYPKALSAQERALAAYEAMGDEAGVAATRYKVGGAHSELGDHRKALSMLERALAAQEALGDKAGAATTLSSIGSVHLVLGDYAKALSTQERALAAMEALGDKRGAARTLGNLGNVHMSLGDYAKALAIQERVLAAKEALRDKAGAAATLYNVGLLQFALGDYSKSLSTHERGLAAMEALGDKGGAITVLSSIGMIYDAIGDYAKALSTQERALAASVAAGAKRETATALGRLGSVYDSIGDTAKALANYELALAAKEAQEDKQGVAVILANLGALYHRLGDAAKALKTFQRVLATAEALGDKGMGVRAVLNIGIAQRSLGDSASALSSCERALAASEALGDKATVAKTLDVIGRLHLDRGDFKKAILFFERSSRAAEKCGAVDLQVPALHNLARARIASGDAGRAIESAHKAVSLLKTLVGGLGEEQGATAREQHTALFSTGLRAAAEADEAPEAAFFLESGRAGTMLESLDARDALRYTAIPDELRLAEAAARSAEVRALAAYAKAQDGADLAVIRARNEELKVARASVQEVVERIQREAKRAANLWYPVATPIEDIRGLLAPGEALVLYGLARTDDGAHALVLTKEDARIVALGESSAIAGACEALNPTDRDVDPAAALDRLRDLVVKPLALPKETKRLLVSPDGPLSYVPFAALAPDLVVAYESSGSTYGVLREEKDKQGEQVLALADADYTAKFNPIALDLYAPVAVAGAPASRGGRLVQLPGTREEATAVADVTLFGKDASEPGLRAALAKKQKGRWHSVHFACHGLVNPDRPTLSSLALTPEGEDDGFLTALEVLKMDIPSDLVVLSACETGKGKIVGGEGIVGLTRAFMYAGAPRVICSLWKVDDDATRALMTKFYELWNPKDGKPGLPTAEALRKAQEFVRSQEPWKHPYYWAAWVLWGLPD